MHQPAVSLLISIILAVGCQDYTGPKVLAPPTTSVTIQVDSTQTFQTWRAWAGRAVTDLPANVRNGILHDAVQDLGINGIGIEARFNSRNPGQTGWDSVGTMTFVNNWVLPLKQLVGSDFHFTVRGSGQPATPLEVTRVLNALNSRGLVPDEWIVLNEPDVGQRATTASLANAAAATCLALTQAGVPTRISGPTNSTVTAALSFAEVLVNDGRLNGCIGELSFHMYGALTQSNLSSIGNLSRQTGIPSGMDEHHGAPITELYDAIEFANISLWQRDGFGGTGCRTCYSLYTAAGSQSFLAGNTGVYRQFYRAIRPGMVRWQATSSVPSDRVVAFGGGGKTAVVVRSVAGDTVVVQGLAAGSYEVFYTLGKGDWTGGGTPSPRAVTLPTVTVTSGQDLKTVIPGTGVITARRIG